MKIILYYKDKTIKEINREPEEIHMEYNGFHVFYPDESILSVHMNKIEKIEIIN